MHVVPSNDAEAEGELLADPGGNYPFGIVCITLGHGPFSMDLCGFCKLADVKAIYIGQTCLAYEYKRIRPV
jgi:hypothetical protein